MKGQTTLAKRGKVLADAPAVRDKFKMILKDPYDPESNPSGFINIGVAENYAVLPEVCDYINKNFHMSWKDFSYGEGPWGSARLREAMAKHMNKTFEAVEAVDPQDIIFTNGVTSVCEMLGFTICDPGDGILFGTPIYQAFKIDFETKAKVQSVLVDFGDVDQFSLEAVSIYEDAIIKSEQAGVKVRAFMLCNPHNPLGQCYPKDTIVALMKLCDKYKLHMLCDEIYASSVYYVPDKKAVPFTSVLSFDHSEYISKDYVHIIYGMSKDFACGGIRLGCVVIQNKELMRAMSAISQFHWSGNPNQVIATTILEDEKWLANFLNTARGRLSERNQLSRKLLDDAGIKYHLGANAGFFLWIDLRPYLPQSQDFKNEWEKEEALVKVMIDNKVFLTNGQVLHAREPGWFRLIFSQDERTLRAGIKRLQQAIGK